MTLQENMLLSMTCYRQKKDLIRNVGFIDGEDSR